jgi:sugar phosphate isomerase/epimerase
MYLALKELGHDAVRHLHALATPAAKIRAYFGYVRAAGVEGIHLEDRYETLGLALTDLPHDQLAPYRLTYHINGLRELFTDQDEEGHHAIFARIYKLLGNLPPVEDVSIHPPALFPPYPAERAITPDRRQESQRRFQRVLTAWIPRFARLKTTLSVESHITGAHFVFDGPDDYVRFILDTPQLGALLDTSHNYFDGYDNADLAGKLAARVTGFHLSDTNRSGGFPDGLHRAVGDGEIDFDFLNQFAPYPGVYGAIEVKGGFDDILRSVEILNTTYLTEPAHIE